jgi:phosphoribosylformylglycinamidine synthase I
MPKLAVIQFPGSNCEYETARAARLAGFQADVVRWTISEADFHAYDAYILPGGFSYQDRIRSGAISAKLPVIRFLKEADELGKPIMGICNGCQILAEAGFIPNLAGTHQVEVALARNMRGSVPHGFVCDWTYIRFVLPEHSLFASFVTGDMVFPIPVNHGEGRFVVPDSVDLTGLTYAIYTDADGIASPDYPITPNGSQHGIAGMCNRRGNVFALMPHPERACQLKQIPLSIESEWADEKRKSLRLAESFEGPCLTLFKAMKSAVITGVSR